MYNWKYFKNQIKIILDSTDMCIENKIARINSLLTLYEYYYFKIDNKK